MFLEQLRLQRFRSCEDIIVNLRPNLTVLVGENNGGKSNVIDGIRLLTLPLNGRRERYAEKDDLRKGSTQKDFRIEGTFSGLSDTLKGLLISAVPDPKKDNAVIGIKHETEVSARGRTTFWAGKYDTSEPEAGSTSLIRHVYLPPLRDAQYSLGSGSPARITALLEHFLNEGEEATFLAEVQRAAAETPPRVINAVNSEISAALDSLTGGVRPQIASLDFSSQTLLDVARDLRFKLADSGMMPAEIRFSGLGYANLLYMATVIVELAKAREADLTLFLVEEPEAHLHPQLQMLVLEFLLEEAKKSARQQTVSGKPEGIVQIIVTTHSPNLTAWVSPERLVVIRSQKDTTVTPEVHRTAAVSIAELGLKPALCRKISRYLDVTRSAMLFGNRALLVEGIAEAILLPVIARHIVLKADKEAWLRFQGAAIVPIDGVDFKPYVEILLRPHNGACIADRLVVITDGDPSVPGNRKTDLEQLVTDFGTRGTLSVFVNEVTLEHAIFAAGNEKLLKHAFLAMHPRSQNDWQTRIEAVAEADRPDAFLTLLADKKSRKGDFAQQIAARIVKGAPFQLPTYLADAIREISRA